MKWWLACVFIVAASIAHALPVTRIALPKQSSLLVEVASTETTRETGLMRRKKISPYDGMLFVFPTATDGAFWMKNTPLPLDILFMDASGTVLHIAKHTTPFSLTPIPSKSTYSAVLELAADRADALHIKPGTRLTYTLPKGLYVD